MQDNYFQLFDMEAKFDIDNKKLDNLYQQQIIRFHPDKFATKSSSEKLQALQNTSLINSAYSVIKSPLKRADYLLSLKGINAFDEKDTQMDIDFLIQHGELREQLEEIKTTKNENELNNFIDNINEKINTNIKQISQLFKEKLDLKKIKNSIRELKFHEQLLKESNNLIYHWLE